MVGGIDELQTVKVPRPLHVDAMKITMPRLCRLNTALLALCLGLGACNDDSKPSDAAVADLGANDSQPADSQPADGPLADTSPAPDGAVDAKLASDATGVRSFSFDFHNGLQAWIAEFADYPVGKETSYQLMSAIEMLPATTGRARKALKLSGNNHSDDLLMYAKRQISGLTPLASYSIRFTGELAANAGKGCVGIGGSPGDSVYIKAGAAAIEPVRTPDTQLEPHYRLNIDIGQQSASGKDGATIGTIANPKVSCSNGEFKLLTFDSQSALKVTADQAGKAWLLVGIDSGFEGTTTVYFSKVDITLTP